MLITEWVEGIPLAEIIRNGTEEQRDKAGRLMAELHLSAPMRAGLLHADPHPGNFRLLPDGRLGVIDFGAVARMPEGTPEPIGRLAGLALRGQADAVVAGLREEGFVSQTEPIDAQALLEWLQPMLTPVAEEEFRFTGPGSAPRPPGSPAPVALVPAEPAAQPAPVLPADPPGDAGLDRGALPVGGEGALPGDPGTLAARFRPGELSADRATPAVGQADHRPT